MGNAETALLLAIVRRLHENGDFNEEDITAIADEVGGDKDAVIGESADRWELGLAVRAIELDEFSHKEVKMFAKPSLTIVRDRQDID